MECRSVREWNRMWRMSKSKGKVLSPGLHSTFGSLFLFLLQAHWELISVETTASGFFSEYTQSASD